MRLRLHSRGAHERETLSDRRRLRALPHNERLSGREGVTLLAGDVGARRLLVGQHTQRTTAHILLSAWFAADVTLRC